MTTINLDIDETITKLTGRHGLDHVSRIRKGVERVASLWRVDDGSPEDFQEFCLKYFITDELERIQFHVEYIEDHSGRRFGAVRLGKVRLIDNVVL